MTGPSSCLRFTRRERLLVGLLIVALMSAFTLAGDTVHAQTPPTITVSDANPTGGTPITLTFNSDITYAQIRWDCFSGTQWAPMTTETECVLISQSGNTATVIYADGAQGEIQSYRACWRQSPSDDWICGHEDNVYFVTANWAIGDQPTPARVTDLSVSVGGAGTLNLAWTAVADADVYHVQWRTADGTFGTANQEIVSANSAVIDSLTDGAEYTVRVAARRYAAGTTNDDDGLGDWSVAATGTPQSVPSPPQVTGVAAAATGNSVTLNWNAATGADGYKVQWKSGSETFDAARQQTTNATSATLTLSYGTAYDFRVIATRTGAADGTASATATATTDDLTLSALDTTGLAFDVLALLESGDNGIFYATSERGGPTGSLLDGEVGVGADNIPLTRIRTTESGQFSINDNSLDLPMSTYYGVGGDGADLRVLLMDQSGALGQSASLRDVGGNYATWNLDSTATAIADGIESGDRLIVAFARDAPLDPPSQVTGVVATAASESNIDVSWDAAANADGYTVRWGTTSGTYSDSAATTSTSHTISGLTHSTEYFIRVTATRTGAADGTASAETSATTQAPAPPAQVAGLTATATSDTEINVSWDVAARADGYRIEWGTTSGTYTGSATTTTTSHTISGLTHSTEYFIRVTATRTGAADGTASAETSATTQALAPPARVTGLTIGSTSTSSINLSWDAATNADGYTVQWGTTSGTYTDSDTTASTSHTISGLTENTGYFIRVTATRTGAANGPASAELAATTDREPPARVTGVSARSLSESSIDVTWTAAARADGYTVQWGTTSGTYTDSATTTTTSHTISGLNHSTRYFIRVTATRTGAADGTASAETSATTQALAPQAQVAGLTATADDHDSITVTWSQAANADGYVVQWEDDSAFGNPSEATIPSGSTVTRQVTGLQEGTIYYVRVKGTRTGAADGAWSATASATTAVQAPAQVMMVATSVTDMSITVSWASAIRADGYRIEWGTTSGTYTDSAFASDLSHTISGLTPSSTYYLRVTATRTGASDGTPSTETSVATGAAPTVGQVTGLSVVAVSDREIQATWTAAANATSYVVQCDTDTRFPEPDQATAATTGVIIELLRAETEYFVRVRGARTGAADGAWSSADSATTLDSQVKVWAERFPGGQVPAQLALGAFSGVLAGIRFKSMKSPRREAVITGAMSLGALILPMFGLANSFWVIGIALLVLICSIAAIFIARR